MRSATTVATSDAQRPREAASLRALLGCGDMDPGTWADWVAAIGTVAAFGATAWLAQAALLDGFMPTSAIRPSHLSLKVVHASRP